MRGFVYFALLAVGVLSADFVPLWSNLTPDQIWKKTSCQDNVQCATCAAKACDFCHSGDLGKALLTKTGTYDLVNSKISKLFKPQEKSTGELCGVSKEACLQIYPWYQESIKKFPDYKKIIGDFPTDYIKVNPCGPPSVDGSLSELQRSALLTLLLSAIAVAF